MQQYKVGDKVKFVGVDYFLAPGEDVAEWYWNNYNIEVGNVYTINRIEPSRESEGNFLLYLDELPPTHNPWLDDRVVPYSEIAELLEDYYEIS